MVLTMAGLTCWTNLDETIDAAAPVTMAPKTLWLHLILGIMGGRDRLIRFGFPPIHKRLVELYLRSLCHDHMALHCSMMTS